MCCTLVPMMLVRDTPWKLKTGHKSTKINVDNDRIGIYVSRSNAGAWVGAEALKQELGLAVWLTSTSPAWTAGGQPPPATAPPPAAGAPREQPTRFLLYLRRDTFEGAAGAELAKELRLALAARFPIVMLHKNDKAAGGCRRFDPIYHSTPAAPGRLRTRR